MVVEGAISNIVDFGAFVDLDGIDGLIHISELSWSHVNHPSEILSIGDVVPVKVLDIDRDRQRISLGLKQTQEDPWQRVIDTYRIGDELEGKVTKVVTFGAFVEIMDGVEGLVHISELAHHHVENPREIVEPGQDVRVKILEIDSERRRLSLSVKRVEERLAHIRSATEAGAAAAAEAGGGQDIGDVPDLGLSEDVFAGPRSAALDALSAPLRSSRLRSGAEAPAEEAAAEEAPAAEVRPQRGRPRPRSPEEASADEAAARTSAEPPRTPAGPRRRARSGRGRSGAAAEAPEPGADTDAPAALPNRTKSSPRSSSWPGSRSWGSPAASAQASPRPSARSASWARRRCRRMPSSTSCSRVTSCARSSWPGWGEVAPNGVLDRSLIAERVFGDEEARQWLEGELWPRVGRADGGLEAGGRGTRSPATCRGGGGPAPVRVRDGRGVRRDDRGGGRRGLRAERAGARGHASVEERTGRQLSQEEKAERADYAVRNDGTSKS